MPRLFAQLARCFDDEPTRTSRRSFLHGMGIGAAALPWLNGCTSPTTAAGSGSKPAEGPRILVVGAGLAGLACADVLRQGGRDVHLLEARSRIGGRVLTFRDLSPGQPVEGGGEWIGSNQPRWLALARRFRIKLEDSDPWETPPRFFLAGRELKTEEAKALHLHLQVLQKALAADAESINPMAPWTARNAMEVDRKSVDEWLVRQPVPQIVQHAFRVEMENENGVPLEWQSLLALLAMVKAGGGESYFTDTEAHRCRDGNDKLAEALADSIGRDRIHLESPVSSIRQNDNGIVIRDALGRTWAAEQVVFTVPPSLWRWIEFIPALPPALIPPMGSAAKYLAPVPTESISELGLNRAIVSDGPVGTTWTAPANLGGSKTAVLTAFAGGPASEAMRAEWQNSQTVGLNGILSHFYPGLGPQIGRTRFMDWPADPWTRGGYTFPPPGGVTGYGPDLYRGLDRIHFAGEHASFGFPGYMEGALESAHRVAATILARRKST